MNWRVLAVGMGLVVPLVVILASSFGREPKKISNALEGQPSPAFVLTSTDGVEISSEALEGGPVVVNFWATWCQPCRLEHPELVQAARVYGPRGVTFLGVLYNDDEIKARGYLERYGSSYPNLLDPRQTLAIDYGVAGVPETFIVDAEGVVVKKITGPINYQTLVQLLEPLL